MEALLKIKRKSIARGAGLKYQRISSGLSALAALVARTKGVEGKK
jgi:hypothetical protein